MAYLLVKALHIMAVIAWMAGLLYLPRLFVYHAECPADDKLGRERFTTMQKRLHRQIMGPAMALSVLLGLAAIGWIAPTLKSGGIWLMLKIVLVIGLIAFHIWCGRQIKSLEQGRGASPKAYRYWNEVPAVAMVLIVLLVVLKPL